jgi:hypothetical protein
MARHGINHRADSGCGPDDAVGLLTPDRAVRRVVLDAKMGTRLVAGFGVIRNRMVTTAGNDVPTGNHCQALFLNTGGFQATEAVTSRQSWSTGGIGRTYPDAWWSRLIRGSIRHAYMKHPACGHPTGGAPVEVSDDGPVASRHVAVGPGGKAVPVGQRNVYRAVPAMILRPATTVCRHPAWDQVSGDDGGVFSDRLWAVFALVGGNPPGCRAGRFRSRRSAGRGPGSRFRSRRSTSGTPVITSRPGTATASWPPSPPVGGPMIDMWNTPGFAWRDARTSFRPRRLRVTHGSFVVLE